MNLDKHAIEQFLHGQIDCWNKGDKQGFLPTTAASRAMA